MRQSSPPLFTRLKSVFKAPILLLFLLGGFVAMPVYATLEWPQELTVEGGKIVVYQPQPDELKGNRLTGRSAFAIEMDNQEDPIFGVLWFTSQLVTDRDAGVATVQNMKVDKVRWPESTTQNEKKLTALIDSTIPNTDFDISLERLTASLSSAKLEQESLEGLNNDAPKIIFKEEIAILLLFDGKPRFEAIENSPYQYAANTPLLVIEDTQNKRFYLSSGNAWYSTTNALKNWQSTTQVPSEIKTLVAQAQNNGEDQEPEQEITFDKPPAIIAATEPTELIVTGGKPTWETLPKGQLLFVNNTETPWLRDIETGNMYVLLAGRWFSARNTKGPWTFVRADDLPTSFADIPPASTIGGVRTSVAGTEEAEEAVLDAQIPQTAAIKRSEATLTVNYDGKPKFDKIPSTKVSYATNSSSQVLLINKVYYAVDNGVWFTSAKAEGPWIVADDIPEEEIAAIPASSPVYNTKYVHVYHSTPEVVYVGYTPGYMWSFPYYGVPVYGTGWRYPPYYGPVYYPRPVTYGFHASYNPWTGWSYGFSWSVGFLSVGMHWNHHHHHHHHHHRRHNRWYGGGYRRPVLYNNNKNVNINVGNINIGNSISVGNRNKIASNIKQRPASMDRKNNKNIYNRPENRMRNADKATPSNRMQPAKESRDRSNNVFSDKDGRVLRNKDNQWEVKDGQMWKKEPSLNPQKPANTRPTQQPERPSNTQPTQQPAQRPTQQPAQRPTNTRPTQQPTQRPTQQPTQRPTNTRPTQQPAQRPTQQPTQRPTNTRPTQQPTQRPTQQPTQRPRTNHNRPSQQPLNTQQQMQRAQRSRQQGAAREQSRRR